MIIPNVWKSKKCSKPPTRIMLSHYQMAWHGSESVLFQKQNHLPEKRTGILFMEKDCGKGLLRLKPPIHLTDILNTKFLETPSLRIQYHQRNNMPIEQNSFHLFQRSFPTFCWLLWRVLDQLFSSTSIRDYINLYKLYSFVYGETTAVSRC